MRASTFDIEPARRLEQSISLAPMQACEPLMASSANDLTESRVADVEVRALRAEDTDVDLATSKRQDWARSRRS